MLILDEIASHNKKGCETYWSFYIKKYIKKWCGYFLKGWTKFNGPEHWNGWHVNRQEEQKQDFAFTKASSWAHPISNLPLEAAETANKEQISMHAQFNKEKESTKTK